MPSSIPVCGFTYQGDSCGETGDHYCEPRATKVVRFFAVMLVHTKGQHARKPFLLTNWQEHRIIRPLFGNVRWSREDEQYIRSYSIGYVYIARKNGKSELLAGISLYMLIGDGEESGEIYGLAKDKNQARLVFDVAKRMVQLSPTLSKHVKVLDSIKRLVHQKSNSFYQVLAADAHAVLGVNPHLVIVDELLAQRDGELYEAMKTAFGARLQPLMLSATTAGNDPDSFASKEHAEFKKIAEDPSRSPRTFSVIYEVPTEADPFDESLWEQANPAIDDFLSRQVLRDEAHEAKNDPHKLAKFRQFRLNQIVNATTRWMPTPLWEATTGDLWLSPDYRRKEFKGRTCFAGLDLASRHDLTAWCLVFGDTNGSDRVDVMWRFWLPDSALAALDKETSNRASDWADDGWLTVTEGDVVDYGRIYDDIEADHNEFAIREIDYDVWSAAPAIQEIENRTGLVTVRVSQNYEGLGPSMQDLMALVQDQSFNHHGNPVAAWCFDAVEVRQHRDNPDLVKPVKPDRMKSGRRIDAVPTAAMATGAWRLRGKQEPETKKRRKTAFL